MNRRVSSSVQGRIFRSVRTAFFVFLTVSIFVPTAAGQAVPAAPGIRARSAILLDFETGTVLYEKDADAGIPPASLAKLVTIYITSALLEEGRLSADTRVEISRNAWAATMPGSSLMFLEPGQRVTVRELLMGLSVVSGNDAAVALAEHIAGSVEAFARLMNRTMANLGFETLRFVDASGLDGRSSVTAREFAEFCRLYIARFPENLEKLHSVREMSYPLPENMPAGRSSSTPTIHQYNRNMLLWDYADVDGLKTGFVDESGYNFAVTAKRGEMRLVLVTLGGPGRNTQEGSRIRAEDAGRLLSYGFDSYGYYTPVLPEFRTVRIWKGAVREVTPTAGVPARIVVPRAWLTGISRVTVQNEEIIAPVSAGTVIGTVSYRYAGQELLKVPLTVPGEVPEGNFFVRLWHSIRLFFLRIGGRVSETVEY